MISRLFVSNFFFCLLFIGLPPRYRDSVRAITPGLPLFLYNYSTHQLHGIFEVFWMIWNFLFSFKYFNRNLELYMFDRDHLFCMFRPLVLEEQTLILQPGRTRNALANHASRLRYFFSFHVDVCGLSWNSLYLFLHFFPVNIFVCVQVRVLKRKNCAPLEEDSFRPILHHYDGPKFRLELNVPEVIYMTSSATQWKQFVVLVGIYLFVHCFTGTFTLGHFRRRRPWSKWPKPSNPLLIQNTPVSEEVESVETTQRKEKLSMDSI